MKELEGAKDELRVVVDRKSLELEEKSKLLKSYVEKIVSLTSH